MVTTMITEKIVLGRIHSTSKHISVILITIGICIYTFASSKLIKNEKNGGFMEWIWGITLLSTSLVLSSRMGVYQEQIHTQWGRHPKEALFYMVNLFICFCFHLDR